MGDEANRSSFQFAARMILMYIALRLAEHGWPDSLLYLLGSNLTRFYRPETC